MKKAEEEESGKMIIWHQSIFTKIKEIFKKLFRKNNKTQEQQIYHQSIDIQEANFKEILKVDMRIEELQRKLKNGQIDLKDIERLDKKKIIELYKKQITQKKNKLDQLKKRISI